MERFFSRLAMVVLVVVLAACSTDFEVNAPYKDVPVVNGFLDPDEPIQYVRVQKGFQNREGDAREIARNIRDSSEFGPNEIEVTLHLVSNNGSETLVGTYTPMESGAKLPNGAFYSPNHRLYSMPTPAQGFQLGQQYRLRINNLRNGDKSVSATTTIVGPPSTYIPNNVPGTPPLDIDNFNTFNFNPGATGRGVSMQLWQPCQASQFALAVKINYTEIQANGDSTRKSIWWNNAFTSLFSSQNTNNCARVGSPLQYTLQPSGFFSVLVDSIAPAAEGMIRYFNPMEFHFYFVNPLATEYLNVTNQFLPITQSQPNYSNVSGGLGLFASRRKAVINTRISATNIQDMNAIEGGLGGRPKFPELERLRFRVR